MKKLLKLYDLKRRCDYFDMINQSFINGQIQQGIAQFKAMPRTDKKDFIILSIIQNIGGLTNSQKELLIYNL